MQAAREGMVLLQNDGVLPVAPAAIKTIAVIGPNADILQLGYQSFIEASHCFDPIAGDYAASGLNRM